MRTPSIAQSFESYRREVIPPDAPPLQIEECRRAFYAATYNMLMTLLITVGDDSTDEEEGIATLERLKAECETFAASIGEPIPLAPPAVPDQSSYNVRHAEVEPALREIATLVKPLVPTGWGFTLMIFSYGKTGLKGEGDAGSMFYISSAQREDMIKAMREFIARNVQ